MLIVKKLITKILKTLNPIVLIKEWSNITPTAGEYKTVAILTLKKNSKYLVLARNGNSVGAAALCGIEFSCAEPTTLIKGQSSSNDTSGNTAIGWCYVETGTADRTFYVVSYGYPAAISAGAKFSGAVVAIPIMGGA